MAGEACQTADDRRPLFEQAQVLAEKGKCEEALELYLGRPDCHTKSELSLLCSLVGQKCTRQQALECYRTMSRLMAPHKGRSFAAAWQKRLRWDPPCRVTIHTEPADAVVELQSQGGRTVSRTGPVELTLPGGHYEVCITSNGYKGQRIPVVLQFGKPKQLRFNLDPADQGGGLWGLQVGPTFTDYGDESLEPDTSLQVTALGGFMWSNVGGRGWLGLQVHALALYTMVQDPDSGEDSGFIGLMGGGGLRVSGQRLWADLRLAAGATILVGASTDSVFFRGARSVTGAFSGLSLRGSVGVGWTLWRGLAVSLRPTVGFMPRLEVFKPDIEHVLRFTMAVELSWSNSRQVNP